MNAVIETLDPILDFIDQIIPGIVGYFSGIVVTTKERWERNKKTYITTRNYAKLGYFLFSLGYLLFVYYALGKRTVESNIVLKMVTTLFNLTLFISSLSKITDLQEEVQDIKEEIKNQPPEPEPKFERVHSGLFTTSDMFTRKY
jgi:hypothetical protein